MQKRTVSLNQSLDSEPKASAFRGARSPSPPHFRIMSHFSSPLLLGPAPSEKLLALVLHLFTEEEADLVQHLHPLRPRSAAQIARLSGRNLEETERTMDFLSLTKRAVLSYGNPRKYTLLPVVPGTFEMVLMTPDTGTQNEWHRKFAVLFEEIWNEGYIAEYTRRVIPGIRYLPVAGTQTSLSLAWPSDRLEDILSRYSEFAVGNCQCRLAMELVGKGCGRPLENCVVMGRNAQKFIDRGLMRRSDAKEILSLKKAAEAAGCVSWINRDIGPTSSGNSSCSCCGCCCHAMRSITQFNAPGLISPGRFLPEADDFRCTSCGKCVKACPMGALSLTGGNLALDRARCIGCGLCTLSCSFKALRLVEISPLPQPKSSLAGIFLDLVPGYLSNAFRIWLKRKVLRARGKS